MKSLNGSYFRVVGNLIALAGLAVFVSCSNPPPPPPSNTVSVSLGAPSIVGPGSLGGIVTISPASSSGPATVGLQITQGSGTLSTNQVSIPQGQTQGSFNLAVNAVTAATNV